MAVDQEFDVFSSLARGIPWNLCNQAVGWRSGGEGDDRAGDRAAGQAPSGGKRTGRRRGSKKLEKPIVFLNV